MNYFVATSIPYVNGEPHIGFGMEILYADVLARAARKQGKPTIFSTGTDEHGTKVAEKAVSLGLQPQQFVDQISQEFRNLGKLLNISNDRFIRTTDQAHEQRAQIIWKALAADIYKDKYAGWYDVRQEEFVPESQADPARMKPGSPQAYQRLEEENYFFRLSKYTDKIREVIENGSFKIVPKTRRKDILRFHAAIWPAMLMSLDVSLPELLFVHGFINVDGQKMSKSLGNVISPKEIVEQYGVDAFRYFFLRHVPAYEDGDFSWKTFEAAYNNELANELGNAVQRTVVMIEKYQSGIIGEIPQAEHDTGHIQESIDACHFDRALDEIWEQVRGLNQYIDEEKPWEVAKNNDMDHLREVLAYQVSCLLEIADLLEPFLPDASAKIKGIFKEGLVTPLDGTLFPKKELQNASEAEQ